MDGLEAFKEIKAQIGNIHFFDLSGFMPIPTNIKLRESGLFETVEKELKALEIIKEKEVNVFIFLHSGDLETYNDMVEDN